MLPTVRPRAPRQSLSSACAEYSGTSRLMVLLAAEAQYVTLASSAAYSERSVACCGCGCGGAGGCCRPGGGCCCCCRGGGCCCGGGGGGGIAKLSLVITRFCSGRRAAVTPLVGPEQVPTAHIQGATVDRASQQRLSDRPGCFLTVMSDIHAQSCLTTQLQVQLDYHICTRGGSRAVPWLQSKKALH